jgi:hypothetical protein
VNLKFDEEPKYEAYMALFEPLCGDRNSRPIQTFAPAVKVGQKRQRDPSDDILLDSTGTALPTSAVLPLCLTGTWRLGVGHCWHVRPKNVCPCD